MSVVMDWAYQQQKLYGRKTRIKWTLTALRTFLSKNKALQHLDVTCNELGESGGKELLLGMETNGTLRSMDMRLCKFDKVTLQITDMSSLICFAAN